MLGCSADGCLDPVKTRGWCARHARIFLFTGKNHVPDVDHSPRSQCEAVGCTKRAMSRGACRHHYHRVRLHGDVNYLPPPRPCVSCGTEISNVNRNQKFCGAQCRNTRKRPMCAGRDCDRLAFTRGFCQKHYGRLLKHGDANYVAPSRPTKKKRLCSVEGCESHTMARNVCQKHYTRLRRYGDANHTRALPPPIAVTPLVPVCNVCRAPRVEGKSVCQTHLEERTRCTGDGCNNTRFKSKLCWGCYDRRERAKATTDEGYLRKGYVFITYMGARRPLHRVRMELHLGRALTREETVHHINGNNADNRLENLELWSKSHPSGQRVEDKVKWAREVLKNYF